MSIRILPVTADKARFISFLAASFLLHAAILFIVPQAREGKKALTRLIPVDVIELPQPLLPSALPFVEEKRIAKPLPLASMPIEKKAGQESLIKKEPVENEKELPSKPIVKKKKPLSLYPTKERLTALSENYEKETPAAENGRDLSFDTSEPRYASYFEALKSRIYHKWGYPDVAAREGQAGRLFVKFVILKDGQLEEVMLVKSSGYPMLDDAALSAIRLAAPYYPFPKYFGSLEKVTINASFEYIMENLPRTNKNR